MGYQKVASLDCDKVYALGGIDSKTNKNNPTSIEGYYLGKRTSETEMGTSTIHVFLTPRGPEGIWGSADTNSKLSAVRRGTMVLVEYKSKKKIGGGKTKKIYEVSHDPDNMMDISTVVAGVANPAETDDQSEEQDYESDEDDEQEEATAALATSQAAKERQDKVKALLSRKGK